MQHLQTQSANIGTYSAEVGATAGQISLLQKDAIMMEELITICNGAKDFSDTAFGIKQRFFNRKTEPPAGAFAPAPDTTTSNPVEAGALKRSRERDQDWLKHQPTISQAAREALDLLGDEQEGISPDSVNVTIEAFAAAIGYEAAVVITGRSNLMYNILMQRDGESGWPVAKSGNSKSINLTITPTTPGKPEQVQLRVQLIKDDANFGQPSEPIYVTFNP